MYITSQEHEHELDLAHHIVKAQLTGTASRGHMSTEELCKDSIHKALCPIQKLIHNIPANNTLKGSWADFKTELANG